MKNNPLMQELEESRILIDPYKVARFIALILAIIALIKYIF